MAKKRKTSLQSTTLHKFFSSGKEPCEYPAADPKIKRATSTRRTPSHSEIIVIDSDEEEDIDSHDNRRVKPRRNSNSSFLEIVEDDHGDSAEQPTKAGEPSTAPSGGKCTPISFGKPSCLLSPERRHRSAELLEDESSYPLSGSGRANRIGNLPLSGPSIGLPDVVCASPSPKYPSSPTNASPSISDIGDMSSLLPTAEPSTTSDSTSKYHPSAAEEIYGSMDDNWDMDGDTTLRDLDLDDEFQLHDNNIPGSAAGGPASHTDFQEELDSCPVCGMYFSRSIFTNIETHVNQCLDSSITKADLSSEVVQGEVTLTAPQGPNDAEGVALETEQREGTNSLFSVLMSSRREAEAWKEAQTVEDKTLKPSKGTKRRNAPFYKVLQGMPIAVDAFRYGIIPGVTAYFLTHAHSDHYTNLAANWKSGPIYCSETTANLIILMLSVDPKWVHPLPMDVATIIPNTGGVKVTLIEANHCPGSCLFLFEGPQTVNAGDSAFKSPFVGSKKIFRYLHCGDFRASPQHVLHPAVKGKRMDHVYLDTTYLDPKYTFPPQPLVLSACAELAKRLATGQASQPDAGCQALTASSKKGWFTREKVNADTPKKEHRSNTLVVVGTYSIGKERVVKAIAKALNTKIYCNTHKAAILHCQADPELHGLLTSDALSAGVHLLPLGLIASDKLKEYIKPFKSKYQKIVGFRPTGWTYTQEAGFDTMPSISAILERGQQQKYTHANLHPTRNSCSIVSLYGVPYSEHSSFHELTCFALSLDWGRMIATVNVGSESSRSRMEKWISKWQKEREKRGGTGEQIISKGVDYW